MSRDYSYETRDPENPAEDVVTVVLPGQFTLKLYKHDPVGYENLRCAKFVLDNVERIFRGLRRYNRGGWCYTGRPIRWHIRQGITAPFPDDLVFAVYINPRYRIFEIRAEVVADNDPMSPYDWSGRYEALVWKRTS